MRRVAFACVSAFLLAASAGGASEWLGAAVQKPPASDSDAGAPASPGGPGQRPQPSAGDIDYSLLPAGMAESVRLTQEYGTAMERGAFQDAERFASQLLSMPPTEMLGDMTEIHSVMLAHAYISQGRYREAERILAPLSNATGQEGDLGQINDYAVLSGLSRLYRMQGRLGESERLAVRAIQADGVINDQIGPSGAGEVFSASMILDLGDLFYRQGRYAEAEAMMERARDIYQRHVGAEAYSTTIALTSLAAIRMRRERYAEAEPLFQQVVRLWERGQGTNGPDVILALHGLSELYTRTGRFAEARAVMRRVMAGSAATFGRDNPIFADILAGQGHNYRIGGDPARADASFLQAMDLGRRLLGDGNPVTISSAAGLAQVRLSSRATGSNVLAPARLAVAGLRARRIAGENDRGPEGASTHIRSSAIYTNLANAIWTSSGARDRVQFTGEAFTALQDASAGPADRAIVEMAVRHVADAAAPGLGALIRERGQLEEQWLATTGRYIRPAGTTRNADSIDPAQVQAERRRVEARLNAIDTRLRAEFPEYFALIRPEALEVNAARQLLAPDEAILMVEPTEFGTHVVGVSSAGVTWVRSDWTMEQVNAAVRRLLWDVGANVNVSRQQAAQWQASAGTGYSYDRQTAFALYQQVVAPVASVLQGKRHVFIAAQGSLSSLPFDILVTEAPQGDNGDPAALRATRWFADAHALIQIPSIQSLQSLRRFRGADAGRDGTSFLGFGDPVLEGQSTERGASRGQSRIGAVDGTREAPSTRSLANIDQLRRLNRLPGTAIELENMRRELNAPRESLFLAQRATEARVRATDLGRANILAFATHGLMAGDLGSGAEPGLVFTPPRAPSEADDGYLTSSEVSALRLNADWVILSACNTAAGDGSQGATGLSGLARAFFYAGARNLLVSHWPVRDSVAARLTVRTIAILRENPALSRAEALQRAMREIRDDSSHDTETDTWAHPNAWAPFMLVGDARR